MDAVTHHGSWLTRIADEAEHGSFLSRKLSHHPHHYVTVLHRQDSEEGQEKPTATEKEREKENRKNFTR